MKRNGATLTKCCVNCKLSSPTHELLVTLEERKPWICLAGYKNPPTTEQARDNQIKHGGELPCVYNPLRQSKRQLPASIAVTVEQRLTT